MFSGSIKPKVDHKSETSVVLNELNNSGNAIAFGVIVEFFAAEAILFLLASTS